jgi:hypothetical protein
MSEKPQEHIPGAPGSDLKPKAMNARGSVGKQFTTEGAIGGTAQKIGGPMDKEGMIGKQFTTEGSLGGTVQDKMGGVKKA